MIKVLANDGIHPDGKAMLEAAGFEVVTEKVAQTDLAQALQSYEVLCVRSATKVRKDLIDACPNLRLITRGGVGMDNIDVEYARSKGITVANTPAASSQAVAELAMAHLLGLSRFLHNANRKMPLATTADDFNNLKKAYEKGVQLKGKTLGIIGFGRIGQAVARIALGMGMRVLPVDMYVPQATIDMSLPQFPEQPFAVTLTSVTLDAMLAEADYITVHVPGGNIIGDAEFAKMKTGVRLVNTARGGVISETALLAARASGKVAGAALDVFENEPTPNAEILTHPQLSLTPHIGAATVEAQLNISFELAQIIIDFYKG
jgi:D-3-phosphoglycerate dehydrogenase / 2-oxoglutarate reductase